MKVEIDLLWSHEIYQRVMREEIPAARKALVIATAFTKQTSVETAAGEYVPFLALVDELVSRGVTFFLLTAGTPSRPFLQSLLGFPRLLGDVHFRICARNHTKAVLIDDSRLYLGSANLTGAGMGGKGNDKRNFELGFVTTDTRLVRRMSREIDAIWRGDPCAKCRAKKLCRREHESFVDSLGTATPISIPDSMRG